jgi:hypothetical protein
MLPAIVRKLGKSAARLVPHIDRAFAERDRLRQELGELRAERDRLNHIVYHAEQLNKAAPQWVPAGHFYSAIPLLSEIHRDDARIFRDLREVSAIDLDEPGQLTLLEELKGHYKEMDFPEHRQPHRRYWFENPAYSYSDAIFLHCMIRQAKPKRLIEVGSGYSSAMTLDTNELHFGDRIQCTFIEPYPELLLSLIRPADRERVEIVPTRVQDVPVERFEALEAGDILFIDSTHVARAGGDVNYLYFEVLPAIRPGVLVHIHDIFIGFQYPRPWIEEGRSWSEAYVLRAFLMYNERFRIRAFNSFIQHFHEDWFTREMPLCLRNRGGSIWLQRVR